MSTQHTPEPKLYAERDPMELDRAGKFFWKHSLAMTAEGLHSKSAIAMELGHRDMVIAQLEQQLAALQAKCDELVDVIKKHGRHESICKLTEGTGQCSCAIGKAIAKAQAGGK
jgi:hypothetical protein